MRRAWATAPAPAAVGLAPRRPRSKSTAPIRRSLVLTECDTADWVMPNACAAAEKLPALSTATSTRSSCGARSVIRSVPLVAHGRP